MDAINPCLTNRAWHYYLNRGNCQNDLVVVLVRRSILSIVDSFVQEAGFGEEGLNLLFEFVQLNSQVNHSIDNFNWTKQLG